MAPKRAREPDGKEEPKAKRARDPDGKNRKPNAYGEDRTRSRILRGGVKNPCPLASPGCLTGLTFVPHRCAGIDHPRRSQAVD